MDNMEFAHKEFFLLGIIPLLMIVWRIFLHKKSLSNYHISSGQFLSAKSSWTKQLKFHFPFALRIIGLYFVIVALARPQSSSSWQDITTEGIDIIISLDISGSMLAEDLKPNRLEASKNVALDFIEARPNDRMGLIVYSGESFTQCPLTTDHAVLKNLFLEIKNGMIEDGTAIGLGLANAVNRLKDSEAKSKVVILLTDGSNTTGAIPPLTAAEIAKSFDVRVYTIGVGTNGMAPYPFQNAFGQIVYQDTEVKIDEVSLKEIANITGGKYFRATDNERLAEIYKEIDQLEKSKINVTEFKKKKEEFLIFALVGLICLALEQVLKLLFFKNLSLA